MSQKTFIDLFAGAGGLSEGFIRKGFVPVAHIEKDKNACMTLKTRTFFLENLDAVFERLFNNPIEIQ